MPGPYLKRITAQTQKGKKVWPGKVQTLYLTKLGREDTHISHDLKPYQKKKEGPESVP